MPRNSKAWRRRRSGTGDSRAAPNGPDESVRLDDEGHSWWATTDGVIGEVDEARPIDEEPSVDEEQPVADTAAAPAAPQGPRTAEELRDAFTKKRRRRADENGRQPRVSHDTFSDYYSVDSLFTSVADPPPPPLDDIDVFDPTDPYAVLGVAMSSSWHEITLAHRRLAKLHHPDRLLATSTDERAASEARMRDINIAYEELKRRRGM